MDVPCSASPHRIDRGAVVGASQVQSAHETGFSGTIRRLDTDRGDDRVS